MQVFILCLASFCHPVFSEIDFSLVPASLYIYWLKYSVWMNVQTCNVWEAVFLPGIYNNCHHKTICLKKISRVCISQVSCRFPYHSVLRVGQAEFFWKNVTDQDQHGKNPENMMNPIPMTDQNLFLRIQDNFLASKQSVSPNDIGNHWNRYFNRKKSLKFFDPHYLENFRAPSMHRLSDGCDDQAS